MKGKKPTRQQKKILQERRLNPDNWLILKICPKERELYIKNRLTNTLRKILL